MIATLVHSTALADDFEDLTEARRMYDKQKYAKAAKILESLVGDEPPKAKDPVVRLESRKYLGAAYLFLGEEAKARRQFELLVKEEPLYEIDPLGFPRDVVSTFTEVKEEIAEERERERAAAAAREKQRREDQMETILRQQERIQLLEEMATTETVEKVNSRWIAIIPFGVGQFQNGHRGLGIGLAVTESVLLAATIMTFIGHNSLRNEDPSEDQLDRARRVEKALRIGNWVSLGLFLGFAVGGVIDAEVRFKPTIRSTRRRELPEEVKVTPDTGATLRFEIMPTGGKLRVDF